MKRSLERYTAKRAFTRTPEPAPGSSQVRQGPLLFVIQKHGARRLHYDFRLELDGVLKSWAVPRGLPWDASEKRLAVEVEDHPFEYGSFEGVIPAKEYGAGAVIVWDCGVYSPDEDRNCFPGDRAQGEKLVREGILAGKLSFCLRGSKLKGSFALVKTKGEKQWLLIKHRDRFAGPGSPPDTDRSVLSGLTLDEMASRPAPQRMDAARLVPVGPQEAMPEALEPMLAAMGDAARSDPQWLYEPKLDGFRVLAFVDGTQVRLQSRGGIDLTPYFPELVQDLADQGAGSLILDGEVVALGPDGRPSFNALQKRAQPQISATLATAQRTTPIVLVCFDVLHFACTNLRGAPYIDRRRYLAQTLLPTAHLQLIHAAEDAEALYRAAIASGHEGIVAKRKDGLYAAGKRSGAWLKIRAVHTAELVIGGYTQGKGGREHLGAMLLGYWEGAELRYAGHVGSGLSEETLTELRTRLAPLRAERSPFAVKPPLHRPTIWLKPELVAEVSYIDVTPAGLLRAPVFIRLREEIAPSAVRKPQLARTDGRSRAPKALATPASEVESVLQQLEDPASRLDLRAADIRLRLTNLDRIYWPATEGNPYPPVTKRDFLRYLAAVSSFMLPHLADRPLTMIRMPEGIHGERFFQKHWDSPLPDFVTTTSVFSRHKAEQHRYVIADSLASLLWLGQNGVLEFHVCHSRTRPAADAVSTSSDCGSSLAALESSVLNYPDYLIFDLDPYIYSGREPAGAEPELNAQGFATGRKVAFWLRALLKQLSLEALVKTSGKTGLHVFVPIERTITFDQAREICELVGRHLLKEHPREITLEWAVEKRTGKIFIDYNMNVRGKTLNAAYSPRGVPGAPVSMPLTWEELEAAEPMDFTVSNIRARLARTGDRWHDALTGKQPLAQAFSGAWP